MMRGAIPESTRCSKSARCAGGRWCSARTCLCHAGVEYGDQRDRVEPSVFIGIGYATWYATGWGFEHELFGGLAPIESRGKEGVALAPRKVAFVRPIYRVHARYLMVRCGYAAVNGVAVVNGERLSDCRARVSARLVSDMLLARVHPGPRH